MSPVAQSRRQILQRKCKIKDFRLSNVVVFKSMSGMFTVLTKLHRCAQELDFARKGNSIYCMRPSHKDYAKKKTYLT